MEKYNGIYAIQNNSKNDLQILNMCTTKKHENKINLKGDGEANGVKVF